MYILYIHIIYTNSKEKVEYSKENHKHNVLSQLSS